MKTRIKYSCIYNQQWSPDLSRKQLAELWEEVLTVGKRFEKIYNRYIDRIIDLIPKYSGYKWSEDFIPIYLVKRKGFSFSDPLTLNIEEDTKLMLVILTHELCHNNVKFKFDDPLERENVMNLVTTFVFRELDLDINEQIKTMIGFTKERFKEKYKPLELDLSRVTAREYLDSKIK